MPRQTNYVPSPEEIAARLQAAGQGLPIPSGIDLSAMPKKIAELERKVAKRRTAAELRQALDLLMEKYDFSPAEQLIQMVMALRNPDQPELGYKMDEPMRVRILETLLEYTVPKLKSIEVSGHVEHQHEVVIVRYGDDGTVRSETLSQPIGPGTPNKVEAAAKVSDKAIDVEVLQS